MTTIETIERLRADISQALTPLVDRDYRYLEMTDHGNVGDTLIFQGEIDFLKTLPFRCREWTTIWSFSRRRPSIPDNDLLILRGSGSFGDLWPTAPTFWLSLLRNYPRNPILFMPQTAHFRDPIKRDELAAAFREHTGRIIVCVRDESSFELVSRFFPVEVYLVPDMAFFIDISRWRSKSVRPNGRRLLIRRQDQEKCESDTLRAIAAHPDTDSADWPTMSPEYPTEKWLSRIKWRAIRFSRFYDLVVRLWYRPVLLRSGIDFLEPYSEVFSTRMHGGILALLLGKPATFFDNSYGKTRAVFKTWLKDCDSARLETGNA